MVRKAMTWGMTALLGAWPGGMVHAGDDNDDEGEANADVTEEIIVVGAFMPRPKREVHGAVTVLNAETLAIDRHQFIGDALKFVPGLAVAETGGIGQQTQVRMRGAEANHTLVLIDGIEANDPAFGSEFDFADLPTGDIERAEVLRGPRSTRYGSDAIGGVINLTSATPAPGVTGRVSASGGTDDTRRLNAAAAYGGEGVHGGIHAARFRTDGISIAPGGAERDGYESTSLSGNAGIDRDRMRLGVVLRASSRDIASDAQDFTHPPTPTQGLVIDADDRSTRDRRHGRIDVQFDPGGLDAAAGWRYALGAGFTDTASDFFRGDTCADSCGYRARRDQFNVDATHIHRDQTITLALTHERLGFEHVFIASRNEHRNEQSSAVLDYRLGLGDASVSASLRQDFNARFDDAVTFQLGGAVPFAGTRFFAAVGTGITNPGFFELFGYFPPSFRGNPALRPEQSFGVDVGADFSLFDGLLQSSATWFTADLTDEIKTRFDPATFESTPVNAPGSSKRRGIELTAQSSWGGGGMDAVSRWTLTGAYTYLDAEDDDGRGELRRPQHAANLTLDFRALRGGAYLTVRYTGAREDAEFIAATPGDRVELDAYTLIDFGASFDLTPGVELFARVANITDEHYQDVFGYAMPGRAAYIGVRLSGNAAAPKGQR